MLRCLRRCDRSYARVRGYCRSGLEAKWSLVVLLSRLALAPRRGAKAGDAWPRLAQCPSARSSHAHTASRPRLRLGPSARRPPPAVRRLTFYAHPHPRLPPRPRPYAAAAPAVTPEVTFAVPTSETGHVPSWAGLLVARQRPGTWASRPGSQPASRLKVPALALLTPSFCALLYLPSVVGVAPTRRRSAAQAAGRSWRRDRPSRVRGRRIRSKRPRPTQRTELGGSPTARLRCEPCCDRGRLGLQIDFGSITLRLLRRI